SAARDFLAGEAVAISRIRNETALQIIKRDCPEARGRRGPRDRDRAAPVERTARVIRGDKERDAVARADRQFAAARDHSARIWIDVGGAGLGPRGPCADRDRAKSGAARQRELRQPETEGGGDREREQE